MRFKASPVNIVNLIN